MINCRHFQPIKCLNVHITNTYKYKLNITSIYQII